MTEPNRSSAARLVATLEALASPEAMASGGLSVAELGRALGRDKSVASRQLRVLVEMQLVERDIDGRHWLGWRLFTLAARAGDQRLLLLAPPVMRRLAEACGERVHLSVLRGCEVLTILSEGSQRAIEAVGWIGRTTPVRCTSSGRALLFDHADDDVRALLDGVVWAPAGSKAPRDAEELLRRLHEARRRGFAVAAGEFDDDLVATSAPVRDFSGRIVAALNVSAPSFRLRGKLSAAGHQVLGAAQHLSAAISSVPAPRA